MGIYHAVGRQWLKSGARSLRDLNFWLGLAASLLHKLHHLSHLKFPCLEKRYNDTQDFQRALNEKLKVTAGLTGPVLS